MEKLKLETIGTSAINYEIRSHLLTMLDYRDGALYWNASPGQRIAVGALAGNVNGSGYHQITFEGKTFVRSRLIWEMHHGEIPESIEVDHVDRNKLNDLISNLELKTRSGNAYNRNVQSNNKLGIKGVSRDTYKPDKFRAYIKLNGKTKNLGMFDTVEAAQEAYKAAGGIS